MIAHYGKFTSSNISLFTVSRPEMGFGLEGHLKKCFQVFFLLFTFQLYPSGLLIYSCHSHASETVSEMAVVSNFIGEMVRIQGKSQNSDFYVSPGGLKNVTF